MASRIQLDTLRTLDHTGISASYAAIGTAFSVLPRIICITNDTDGSIIVSDDPLNSSGKLYLPKGSFKLFDLTTNANSNYDDTVTLPLQMQLYVKQSTTVSSGIVTVEIIYAV